MGQAERVLILHYHLFKNAGTSVDAMLRRNFGKRWEEREFGPRGRHSNVQDVSDYLETRPDLLAFSSHTARLPLPQLEGVRIFPILFLRHPIVRLRSAYSFERRQRSDTPSARFAKGNDLAGYLRELLAIPGHRQARNFQTQRLSFNELPGAGRELERASRTLKSLPFVGLVEEYDRSLDRLQDLLRPLVPDFRTVHAHMNVSRAQDVTVEESLFEIEREIGPALYAELCAANEDDIELYAAHKHSFAQPGDAEPAPGRSIARAQPRPDPGRARGGCAGVHGIGADRTHA